MRAVAQAGFRAVAPDMRGHGASHAPADASLCTALHAVGDPVGAPIPPAGLPRADAPKTSEVKP